MPTITFNPENWVDDQAEMQVSTCGNIIKVNGETLRLKRQPVQRDEDGNAAWDFYQIEVHWDGRLFCNLSRFGKDDEWECNREACHRTHTDPAQLAAIMACNLI